MKECCDVSQQVAYSPFLCLRGLLVSHHHTITRPALISVNLREKYPHYTIILVEQNHSFSVDIIRILSNYGRQSDIDICHSIIGLLLQLYRSVLKITSASNPHDDVVL